MSVTDLDIPRRWPDPAAALTMIRPITWFPPMWAYACGVVSSGVDPLQNLPAVLLGLILAGPLADAAGLHATFLALSLPMLLLGVVAVFLPALRELDLASKP